MPFSLFQVEISTGIFLTSVLSEKTSLAEEGNSIAKT
jgi:hypothetical protein